MSALAIMLQSRGFEVRGSDEAEGGGTKILQQNNIFVDFALDESAQKAMKDADLVVASSAIRAGDAHLLLAEKFGKKVICRGALLGAISAEYEKVVAVSGSHGKTTTTAMIFEILQTAGKNPTLHLGGYRAADGQNFHLGGKEFFVTEACEYCNNFLFLQPQISVITNVEKEHMDFFKTFSNQLKSFKQFRRQSNFVIDENDAKNFVAKKVRHKKDGGLEFSLYELKPAQNNLKTEQNNLKTVQNNLNAAQNNLKSANILKSSKNDQKIAKNELKTAKNELKTTKNTKKHKVKVFDLSLQICEEVNIQNCIYALLVARRLGIPDCITKIALENFRGVALRFERKKCPLFDTVICDYAHHPTEIAKAIETAKKVFKGRRLVTIFQPHTYSRTQTLLPQFLHVFKDLPLPIFFKTYSARESETDGMSAQQFCQILQKINKNALFFENFEDLKAFLCNFCKSEDVLLFLGAGDLPAILHKNKFVE